MDQQPSESEIEKLLEKLNSKQPLRRKDATERKF